MYHLKTDSSGSLVLNVALFPGADVRDFATTTQVLSDLKKHLADDLGRRVEKHSSQGQSVSTDAGSPTRSGARPEMRPSPAQRPGHATVRVKFLGLHAGLKGAFWVQEPGQRKGLVKYGKPPDPLPAEGQEIHVYSTNVNPQSPEYRWDPPPPAPSPQRGGRPRGRS